MFCNWWALGTLVKVNAHWLLGHVYILLCTLLGWKFGVLQVLHGAFCCYLYILHPPPPHPHPHPAPVLFQALQGNNNKKKRFKKWTNNKRNISHISDREREEEKNDRDSETNPNCDSAVGRFNLSSHCCCSHLQWVQASHVPDTHFVAAYVYTVKWLPAEGYRMCCQGE